MFEDESKHMIAVDKIAVFDLDGTLYEGNSHIEILNDYYKTSVFSSFFMRGIGRLFPKVFQIIIDVLYEHIPKEYVCGYTLPFCEDVLNILNKKKEQDYELLIISNAPFDLIGAAAKKLGIPYMKAPINKKGVALLEKYSFKKLFVCTDNKTDVDLLNMADCSVVCCKDKAKKYFKNNIKNNNYVFLDELER